MEIAGYFSAFVMGLSLGMIGAGGSILSVPIFVYLFGVLPCLSTAYSLFVVGLTALFGFFTYAKQGLVNYKTGIMFSIPAFVGVYSVRRYLMPSLPEVILSAGGFTLSRDNLIMLVFAILMLLAARAMIKKRPPPKPKDDLSEFTRILIIAIEGVSVGGLTGFVGAGGGFLIIPALVLLTGLPMKEAVGTSLGIIAVKSLFGFVGDFQSQSYICWNLLFIFSIISIAGIFAGAILGKKIPEDRLKPAFGWFVLVMGTFIIVQQIFFKS